MSFNKNRGSNQNINKIQDQSTEFESLQQRIQKKLSLTQVKDKQNSQQGFQIPYQQECFTPNQNIFTKRSQNQKSSVNQQKFPSLSEQNNISQQKTQDIQENKHQYTIEEDTQGNGDCLFNGFLQSIGISQAYAQQLREIVYESLTINTNIIENYLQFQEEFNNISITTYLNLIKLPGFWGGEPELQILSYLSGININVINNEMQNLLIRRGTQQANEEIQQIDLKFNGTHYKSIYCYTETQFTPETSPIFERIRANKHIQFNTPLVGDQRNLLFMDEVNQQRILNDQEFINFFRQFGNLDKVFNLIMQVEYNESIEEFSYRQSQQTSVPIKLKKDFLIQSLKNIYQFPHCVDQTYELIQGSNILNEAFQYYESERRLGEPIIPLAWSDKPTAKSRYKYKSKRLLKIQKYMVQECNIQFCNKLHLFQVNAKKGKQEKKCRILTKLEQDRALELSHINHESARQMHQNIWDMGGHWYSIGQDCKDYVKNCQICIQDYQKTNKRSPVEFINPVKPMFRHVIDCVEMPHSIVKRYFPKNSITRETKIQLLTVINAFSKKANAFYIPNKQAITIKKYLKQHFTNGQPEQVLSDNGTEFCNKVVDELMDQLGIEYIHGRPYHPQTQGVIERFNRTIQQQLYKKASQDELNGQRTEFQEVINDVIMVYNNKIHSSHGMSPMEASMINDPVQQEAIVEKMKAKFPKKIFNTQLEQGDKVLVLNDVYLQKRQKGKQQVLIRNVSRKNKKRSSDRPSYSLRAIVEEDSSFNIKLKFCPGQSFSSDIIYTVPREFTRQISNNLFLKLGKGSQKQLLSEGDTPIITEKELKPCMICMELEHLKYTQCCNQPIHLQCYENSQQFRCNCPQCRQPEYQVQEECLVEGRQYIDCEDSDVSIDIGDLDESICKDLELDIIPEQSESGQDISYNSEESLEIEIKEK